MAKPTKGEIRAWMKRCRENLVGLNKALSEDKPRQVHLYISDALGCLEEIAAAAEERYDITIECAEIGPSTKEAVEEEEEYEDDDEEFEDEDDEDEDDEDEEECE